MIDMLLSFWSFQDKDFLYSGQSVVQVILFFAAVICVPWMLIFKPWYLKRKHNAQKPQQGDSLIEHDDEKEPLTKSESHHGGAHGEEFEFGEIVIHQIIHTIEFVLGAISNTASYLRLWALSLAHAELSQVFF